MREFSLTVPKGKDAAKLPSRERDPIIDYLHEFKTATYEELTSVVGRDRISKELRELIDKGLVLEKRDNW